jgi:uncharacterized protein YqgC (DUF456 family)
MTVLFWIVAGAAVVVGLAGTLLPALPGPALVFAGLLLAAWIDGFSRVGWPTLVVLAVLTAATYAVDLAAAAVGVKRFGASPRAAVGAALGTLLGLPLGLPGLVAGPFVGAVIGEYSARRRVEGAARAGLGAWLGFLIGTLVKLAIVFTMVGLFLAALSLF